jgi:hypothetical protein
MKQAFPATTPSRAAGENGVLIFSYFHIFIRVFLEKERAP